MNFPSKLVENAINELAKLPGIGRKTATRLALHLLKQAPDTVELFGNTLVKMRNEVKYCKKCENISDHDICNICNNPNRDQTLICVVESPRDVLAIENTGHFTGVYHVLGGVISPVEGIGPETLTIKGLVDRVYLDKVKELVMALSPTIEGDTTIYYISKKLKTADVTVTTISRGVSFGSDLEYTDDLTLARSIVNRQPYENYMSNK